MSTDVWALWREAIALGVGHGEELAARVDRTLADARWEELEPMADRALALHHAGLAHARAWVPLVLYAAAREREGRTLPARFHGALVMLAPGARYAGLLPRAGRALRLVPDELVRALDDARCPVIDLLGHVGGAERARRFVAQVRDWPKGAYGALKKAAGPEHKRAFELAYGYSAAEHEGRWIAGLSAFGEDAIEPLVAALAHGSAQAGLLFAALGRIGGEHAARAIGDGLARASASDRKAARRGFDALGPDDGRRALEHARASARGAAAKSLADLAVAEPALDLDNLRHSEGRAWTARGASLETLEAMGAWWIEHLAGDAWFSARPAYDEALAAHASIDGALELAVEVLPRIERGGAQTLGALFASFGRERVLPHVHRLLREGRLRAGVNEEVLRALLGSTGVPTAAAIGAARGGAKARELALSALLGSELETSLVIEALADRDDGVRTIAARVIEVRSIVAAFDAITEALAREKVTALRLVLSRTKLALAAAKGAMPIDEALGQLEGALPKHIPAMPSTPLRWASGEELSVAARHGLLLAFDGEDHLGPSPLARRAARALDEASAQAWASELWIEKPNLSRRADTFRTYAALALMSDVELTRCVARIRRRRSTPLYAAMASLLKRRDTAAAHEARRLFGA